MGLCILAVRVREDAASQAPETADRYAWYALGVLALVYMLNFLDRQILSILAEAIKEDLGVSDAQLGFLYGTAFALFYAVFGIPLARLSDSWIRKNVIALGVALWSLMTALSGTARSVLALGAYRIGVGVGESSATPAAYSLLSDYFPPRLRATALSLYAGGLYVGQGVGLFLGGFVLDRWDALFPGGIGWWGLRGWQVAFFLVGFPGLALAVWVWRLREPVRGASEGLPAPEIERRPGRKLFEELLSVIPPFTLVGLRRAGASWGQIALNLLAALLLALTATGLVLWLGAIEQWVALAIGLYSTFSWAQGLSLSDPPTFAMLFRSAALRYTLLGLASASFVTYSYMFWTPSFLLRNWDVSPTEVGFSMLIANLVGAGLGVTGGGMISDRLKRRMPAGRVYAVMVAMLLHVPTALLLLFADSLYVAYAGVVAYTVATTSWVGSANALVTELVLPRMRAVAAAGLLLVTTFAGLALGPFTVGWVSDGLVATGASAGDALREALLLSLLPMAICVVLLGLASRRVPAAEASVVERARAAGEPEAPSADEHSS